MLKDVFFTMVTMLAILLLQKRKKKTLKKEKEMIQWCGIEEKEKKGGYS
jgi:hypothetical protein